MLIYGIGALILIVVLYFGVKASRGRNRANDKITDAAVRAQYKEGDNYDPEKFRRQLK